MNEFKNILFTNCGCILNYKISNFWNYYSYINYIYNNHNNNNNLFYNKEKENYIFFKDIKPQVIKRDYEKEHKKDYEIINNDNDFDFEIIKEYEIKECEFNKCDYIERAKWM